jgi:hypothetical protein
VEEASLITKLKELDSGVRVNDPHNPVSGVSVAQIVLD